MRAWYGPRDAARRDASADLAHHVADLVLGPRRVALGVFHLRFGVVGCMREVGILGDDVGDVAARAAVHGWCDAVAAGRPADPRVHP